FLLRRLGRRFDEPCIGRQPEIIVRAEIDPLLAVERHTDRLLAVADLQVAPQILRVERRQFLVEPRQRVHAGPFVLVWCPCLAASFRIVSNSLLLTGCTDNRDPRRSNSISFKAETPRRVSNDNGAAKISPS